MIIHFISSFIFIGIVYTNKTGSAIKCYQCNSHFDPGCELDAPPSSLSVDCSSKNDRDEKGRPIEYTFCRKIHQVIEFAVNQCMFLLSFLARIDTVNTWIITVIFILFFFSHLQCHQIRESFVAVALIPEVMRVNVTNVMVLVVDKWCALAKTVITVITQTHYKVPWCW